VVNLEKKTSQGTGGEKKNCVLSCVEDGLFLWWANKKGETVGCIRRQDQSKGGGKIIEKKTQGDPETGEKSRGGGRRDTQTRKSWVGG